jgi:hypothetical protein
MTMALKNNPFLLLHQDQEGLYYVFLVNPTNHDYTNVRKTAGAFFSGDGGTDDFLDLGQSVLDLGELPKNSYIQIDKIHWMARDFTTYYNLDLIRDSNNVTHLKSSVLKYNPSSPIVMVAHGLNKSGWILD